METVLHLRVIAASVPQARTNLDMVNQSVFFAQLEHFRAEQGRDPYTTAASVLKENFSLTKAERLRQLVPYVFRARTRQGLDRFQDLTALYAAQGKCKRVKE